MNEEKSSDIEVMRGIIAEMNGVPVCRHKSVICFSKKDY